MTTYAYLRVSTDQQDADNQRHGVLEYCNGASLGKVEWVEDTASGKIPWRKRKLGELLESLSQGDVLVFAEISRVARSTLQVLEVLELALERGVALHIAKQRMTLDDSLNAKIIATSLGMAAEIERYFISQRTVEALAKRKAEGKTLGRPKGKAERLALDDHRDAIEGYLAKGVSMTAIAKIIGCAKSTLYEYTKRRGITKEKAKAKFEKASHEVKFKADVAKIMEEMETR